MKWTAMYLFGFLLLLGGGLAALWHLGVIEAIGLTWTVIGTVILLGFGIMIAVSRSGLKQNIEIDHE